MTAPTYGQMRSRARRLEDEAIKSRVLRGLEKLREAEGADWVAKIDCETLDLADWSHCVLGQVYGDFDAGVDKLGLTHEGSDAYGFTVGDDLIGERPHLEETPLWDALDSAWHRVLCPRRRS